MEMENLPERPRLLERCVLLTIHVRKIGNSKKVTSSIVQTEADKMRLSVSKKLLESRELSEIFSLDRTVKAYIYSVNLPNDYQEGLYMIPISRYEEVQARLEMFKRERQDLIEKFVAVYEDQVLNAQNDLKELYNPADYPPLEVMRSSFAMDWNFLEFTVPQRLEKFDSVMYKQELEKFRQKWQEAENYMVEAMRENAATLVNHLVDVLKPTGEDKKQIKEIHLEKVREFIGTWKQNNVADDSELDGLIKQAKDLLEGVSGEGIRKSDDIREMMYDGFSQIKEQIDGMVTKKPKRAIDFEALDD